jgi:hypothetical protein
MDLDKLAEELNAAKDAGGFTSWREAAAIAGVDSSAITKINRYKVKPTIQTIQKLSKALAPDKAAYWLSLAGYDLVPSSDRKSEPLDLEHIRVNLRASGKLSPEVIDIVLETIKEIEESDKSRGT